MKYSAGLANRAVIAGNGFQAGERGGSGRQGLRVPGSRASSETEEGMGSQGRGRGLEATSRGESVRNTDPHGILSACVCLCMRACVCACVHVRGQVTVFSGKLLLSSNGPFARGQEEMWCSEQVHRPLKVAWVESESGRWKGSGKL